MSDEGSDLIGEKSKEEQEQKTKELADRTILTTVKDEPAEEEENSATTSVNNKGQRMDELKLEYRECSSKISTATTENDVNNDGKTNANYHQLASKISHNANDCVRCLILASLPTSLFDESLSAFTDTVVEIVNKTFALPIEAVECVYRFAKIQIDLDNDSAVRALIVFRSRVHKHRMWTQRTKLEAPMSLALVNEWPTDELTEDQENEILAHDVSDEMIVSDQVDDNVDESIVLGGDKSKNGIESADKITDEIDENGDEEEEYEGDMAKTTTDKDDAGHHNKNKWTPVTNWDGAPEFQWKTSVTMRMKGVLEKKLGIVNEEFVKSRQLLVREISDECSDADVRNAFALLDNVDSVEFRHDALDRRCALVTFGDSARAIRTHMKFDEVRLGVDHKWTRVYHMQDIFPTTLLSKFEGKMMIAPNKRQKSDTVTIDVATVTDVAKKPASVPMKTSVQSKPAAASVGAGASSKVSTMKSTNTDRRSRSRSPKRKRTRLDGATVVAAAANNKISCYLMGAGAIGIFSPTEFDEFFPDARGRGGNFANTRGRTTNVTNSYATSSRGNVRGTFPTGRGSGSRGTFPPTSRGNRFGSSYMTSADKSGGIGGYGSSHDSRYAPSYNTGGGYSSYGAQIHASPWATTPPSIEHRNMHSFAARALGGGVNYRDNSEMAAMIREQQEQVALEQQLMQQQDVINKLEGELRNRSGDYAIGGGYGSGGMFPSTGLTRNSGGGGYNSSSMMDMRLGAGDYAPFHAGTSTNSLPFSSTTSSGGGGVRGGVNYSPWGR